MPPENCEKMRLIAEVTMRRFFAHYLEEVLPEQLEVIITAHNRDVTAHAVQIKNAVRAESSRVKLWLWGLVFTGGFGGGVGIVQVVSFFAK